VEHKNLYNQVAQNKARVLAIGEILWDVFDDSSRLGGAPLNFSVNASRLGHDVILVSALGEDVLGNSALQTIQALGLDVRFVRTTARFPTGIAMVQTSPNGDATFHIHRPAAYDAVQLSEGDLRYLTRWAPGWLYYGTLFSSTDSGLKALRNLIHTLPEMTRFYDVNLRPDSYSPELLLELLDLADVVKLNAAEMEAVRELAGLPSGSIEDFCRAGVALYGWKAVCVTMGALGCAVLSGGSYARAEGCAVEVVDTVGAGDGFAAAFLHGLAQQWQPSEIGAFANRIGAMIASHRGAIPDWNAGQIFDWAG